jgi:MraZ protein
MRFLGNIEAKTDAKGRIFLPAIFRKVLQAAGEEVLVMRKDVHQRCLVLYPESTWNRRMDALLEKINEWDDVGQQVLRQYVSEAEVLTLDGNGRFLIPKRYLQMADIEQGVRFIGINDAIEIWAVEKTQQPFLPQEEFAAKLKAIMTVTP